jgi:hypothetical protein
MLEYGGGLLFTSLKNRMSRRKWPSSVGLLGMERGRRRPPSSDAKPPTVWPAPHPHPHPVRPSED